MHVHASILLIDVTYEYIFYVFLMYSINMKNMISKLSEGCRNSAYRSYIEPRGPLRKFKKIMTNRGQPQSIPFSNWDEISDSGELCYQKQITWVKVANNS